MKGFVFLCCVLFFVLHGCYLLATAMQPVPDHYFLQKVSVDTFFLADSDKNNTGENTHFYNVDSASLTPFFFDPIPLNYCSKELLLTVSGIGPSLAQKIIETKETEGYFKNKHDLLKVPGIGIVRMNTFSPFFSFSIPD